jgi:hypothetical protein
VIADWLFLGGHHWSLTLLTSTNDEVILWFK